MTDTHCEAPGCERTTVDVERALGWIVLRKPLATFGDGEEVLHACCWEHATIVSHIQASKFTSHHEDDSPRVKSVAWR